MGNPVVHFEINTRNARQLTRFYADAFGWKIPWNDQMNYGLVDTESDGKGINGGIGPREAGNWVTFYVEVADPQATLAKIERLGGKTVTPMREIPGVVTFAVFEDPDGNRIGLVKAE